MNRRQTLTGVSLSLALVLTLPAAAQTPEELRDDVLALTGPGTDGRAVGTAGAATARRYLISELEAAGARPLPGQDGLGIPFRFISGVEDRGSSLRAGGHKRFGSDQVKAFAFSETGEVRGELYFTGYGIRVPESAGVSYDSYAGHDVRDKVVVVLRYFPDDVEDETRSVLNRHADFRSKASAARDQGAAGMVMITGPGSEGAGELAPDGFDISAPGSQGVLAVSIDGAAGDRLFAGTGVSLAEVQRSLDAGEVDAGSFPLPGFATLAVDLERTPTSGANVVGILPAADGSLDPPYVARRRRTTADGTGHTELFPPGDGRNAGTRSPAYRERGGAIPRAMELPPLARDLPTLGRRLTIGFGSDEPAPEQTHDMHFRR